MVLYNIIHIIHSAVKIWCNVIYICIFDDMDTFGMWWHQGGLLNSKSDYRLSEYITLVITILMYSIAFFIYYIYVILLINVSKIKVMGLIFVWPEDHTNMVNVILCDLIQLLPEIKLAPSTHLGPSSPNTKRGQEERY